MPDLGTITNEFFLRRRAMRPTRKTWLKHTFFLLVTVLTTTLAGVLEPFGILPIFPRLDPQTFAEGAAAILTFPFLYWQMIGETLYLLFARPDLLLFGLSFSLSLLFILTSHEMGHYIACRIYGVDATLPYFLPLPPLIGPAGTLGAFIKIVSPLPSRRATFDIGIAGPIAGFIALIPIALIGVGTMSEVSAPDGAVPVEGQLYFSDPIFMKMLAYAFGIDLTLAIPNPFYWAAWLGLLVTALNLIPAGQLDGGHALYAALGERFHYWTGRVAFVAMAAFSVLGWFVFNSPAGFLFAVFLGVMMRVRHPAPRDMTPLDLKRKIIAVIGVLIFILCFVPFPIQIS